MRAWSIHIALLVAAILFVAKGVATHTSTEEAWETAFDESAAPDDRIWAIHLASNRATERSDRIGRDLALSLLGSRDLRLREVALLIDVCRHAFNPLEAPTNTSPPIQDRYVYGPLPRGEWTPHRLRSLILYRRKVGGLPVGGINRMTSTEGDWILRTLRGDDLPPSDEIDRYLRTYGHVANTPR